MLGIIPDSLSSPLAPAAKYCWVHLEQLIDGQEIRRLLQDGGHGKHQDFMGHLRLLGTGLLSSEHVLRQEQQGQGVPAARREAGGALCRD